jgi:endoglucanase
LFFAVAVLTKVTAVMFGPPILLYALMRGGKMPIAFRAAVWLMTSIFTTSVFLLFAAINGEFFPAQHGEHVSFLESLKFQASRGSGVPFWEPGSSVSLVLHDWMIKDRFAMVAGAYAMAFAILMSLFAWFEKRYHKELSFFVLSYVFYIIFLTRGGIVINFYVIPIIPFAAAAVATTLNELVRLMYKHSWERNVVIVIITLLVGTFYATYAPTRHFTADETMQQKKVIKWIKTNLPNDSAIIMDNYGLTDIWSPKNINEKTFPNSDWFYKVNRDPAIRYKKFHNDWQSFDYLALTHEMLTQIRYHRDSLTSKAFLNSTPVAKWLTHNNKTVVDEQRFLTTNGDWAMIFRVQDLHYKLLEESWRVYQKKFITNKGDNYGQVIDPFTDSTTSEGQSYAMLRATWANDRQAFIGSWLWTRNHLQYRKGDKLFSWKWKDGKIFDSANATDADEDIALALLFAYKLWNDESYLYEAKQIINDIWEHAVKKINGTYYILPMHITSAARYTPAYGDVYILNPSYISPAHYRVFAKVDPDKSHHWDKLADDSYKVLNRIAGLPANKTSLPPDWIAIDAHNGRIYTANPYFDYDTELSRYDSFRIIWRVALDDMWFQTPQSRKYLREVGSFLLNTYQSKGRIPAFLQLNGSGKYQDVIAIHTIYALALSYIDQDVADKYFETHTNNKYHKEKYFWGDGTNYYDANWAWFGSGAFYKNLTNLWTLDIYQQ